MITNILISSNKLFSREFLYVIRIEYGETRTIAKNNNEILPKINWTKPEKQTDKKEKGLGKGIFASLPVCRRRTMGWERFRNSSVKRKAKQRNFLFLN